MVVPNLHVELISPADREFLCAAIMLGNEQLAEMNVEGDRPSVEIYGPSSGGAWQMGLGELQAALDTAAQRLKERTGRG